MTRQIVDALEANLTTEEQEQLSHQDTDDLEAYDYYLRGREYFYRNTQTMNAQARQMFERALELDPRYAAAYAMLGFTHWADGSWRWSPNPHQSLEQMSELVQKALAVDDSLPLAYQLLGYAYLFKEQQYEQAIAAAEHAIALSPNDAESYARLATILSFSGLHQFFVLDSALISFLLRDLLILVKLCHEKLLSLEQRPKFLPDPNTSLLPLQKDVASFRLALAQASGIFPV